jgi:hypothetical protein
MPRASFIAYNQQGIHASLILLIVALDSVHIETGRKVSALPHSTQIGFDVISGKKKAPTDLPLHHRVEPYLLRYQLEPSETSSIPPLSPATHIIAPYTLKYEPLRRLPDLPSQSRAPTIARSNVAVPQTHLQHSSRAEPTQSDSSSIFSYVRHIRLPEFEEAIGLQEQVRDIVTAVNNSNERMQVKMRRMMVHIRTLEIQMNPNWASSVRDVDEPPPTYTSDGGSS